MANENEAVPATLERPAPPAIDLAPFCGDKQYRYALTEPFVVAGWRYASDGFICVRVRAEGEPDSIGKVPTQGAIDSIFGDVPAGEPIPWSGPIVVVERGLVCPECKGDKTVHCDYCQHDHDCDTCQGDGRIPVTARSLGAHLVRESHDRLISALPGVRYWREADLKKTMRFTFDGGEGVVLSVNKDECA